MDSFESQRLGTPPRHHWYSPAGPVRTPAEQIAALLRATGPPKVDLLKARREAFEEEMRLDTATRWPFWVLKED